MVVCANLFAQPRAWVKLLFAGTAAVGIPPPQFFEPEPQEVASVAAAGGDGLFGRRAWSTQDGAEAWAQRGARDRQVAGSQDRRFPLAVMKNSL